MLEQLLKGALQGLAGGSGTQGAAGNPLLEVVASLISGAGGSGGLSGLVQQFQQAGLGNHVNSWISTGQNLPISPDQLGQVFGQGQLEQLASKAGLNADQFGGALSQLLPQVIDQLTPHGQVPSGGVGGVGDILGALTKGLGR